MANSNLTQAKRAKNDEFYTQFIDIQKEIQAYVDYNPDVFRDKIILMPCDDPEWSNFTRYFAQNFERFGIKKMISTSYASGSKSYTSNYQATLFETEDPQYDKSKTKSHGKIYILDHDTTGDGTIDIDDLEWQYLEWDGDFRSKEVTVLRDEADIIITNPPFSLFRDFLAWIVEWDKQFTVIGNMNAITYKETFPLIKDDKMWLGATNFNTWMYFEVPEDFEYASTYKFDRERNWVKVNRVPGVCRFTNIDHGKRYEHIPLMTMEDNRKFNKQIQKKAISYQKYDNYDAIEVPYTSGIPSDYQWVMGVPISFLDKYSPDQFKLVWFTSWRDEFECIPSKKYINPQQHNPNWSISNWSKANTRATISYNAKPINWVYYTAENTDWFLSIVYARILIQHRND